MKFIIERTSDHGLSPEQPPVANAKRDVDNPALWVIDIASLEELRELSLAVDERLILSFQSQTIEIYDDYRE